jgi:hypothetical protein
MELLKSFSVNTLSPNNEKKVDEKMKISTSYGKACSSGREKKSRRRKKKDGKLIYSKFDLIIKLRSFASVCSF